MVNEFSLNRVATLSREGEYGAHEIGVSTDYPSLYASISGPYWLLTFHVDVSIQSRGVQYSIPR